MKTYKDFLTEKKMPSSPVGKARALKSAQQNDKNRAAKFGPAEKGKGLVQQKQEKGGSLVHQPGKGTVGKETVGTTSNPRDTPKRPPGVSGTTQTTTARMGRGGPVMSPKDREKLQRKREKKENKKLDQKAQQIYNKKNSGVMSGVKSALGGDVIGSKESKGKGKLAAKYNEIAKKDREQKRKEFAKKKVGQAGNLAKNVAGRILGTKTDGELGVSYASDIV